MVVLALHWPWTIIYQARVSGQSITLLLHLFAPGWRLATWVLCPRHSYHYHHQLESILFVTKKWLRIWSNEIIFCQMISSMNLHGMTQEKFTHNVTPLLLYAVSLSLSLSLRILLAHQLSGNEANLFVLYSQLMMIIWWCPESWVNSCTVCAKNCIE